MVGSAPQRLVDFGSNPSDDEIGSPAVASGGKRYPRRSPNPGGCFWSFSGVDSACSGRVVGGVGSAQGVEVDFGELLRFPGRQNVDVKHVRSGRG